MSFRKILCPTDFSPGSQQAMRVAARLANEANAEIVLVHSWYLPVVAFADYAYPEAVIQEMSDDAARGLELATRDLTLLGVKRVTSKMTTGLPWHEIVNVAEQDDALDLIVIGTHGRTGLKRVLLGSVTEKVIRHSPCSVLAVRPDSKLEPFQHALCPTDFSESAAYAVDLASEIMSPDGAITLMHVIELPVRYAGEMPVPGLERELDKRAADALDACAVRLRGKGLARIATHSRIGYPGAQTLAMLDHDPTIDVVIMGSNGRTGISRALLGSVAEKVTRHARCPVVIARARA
jgi:nucleotide-binding universal stress UspA family protein